MPFLPGSLRDGPHLVGESMRRAVRAALGRLAREGLPRSARGDVVVLDVGGRGRPYESLAASVLSEAGYTPRHVVMDPGPASDVVGVAEAIPVRAGTAGLVMCTQVLEHVDRPDAAVAEMARVLAPSGACLLTTHGTWFYHPDPEDYWRWTALREERCWAPPGASWWARPTRWPGGSSWIAGTGRSGTACRESWPSTTS